MKLFSILPVLVLGACQAQPNCKSADKMFMATFEAKLEIIKSAGRAEETPVKPLSEAYVYMFAVTGIKPRISDFDTPHYKVRKYFFEDLKKWEEWYKVNKCSMTTKKADSLFMHYWGE